MNCFVSSRVIATTGIKTFHGRKLHHTGESQGVAVEVTHKVEISKDSDGPDDGWK